MANGEVVCVTGGSGFIGSWLVKSLLDRGYTVHATVRNLNDEKETKHLLALEGAESRLRLYQIDLLNYDSIVPAITGAVGVFHLASPCIVDEVKDPENDLLSPAIKGTINVLTASKELGVKRVVVTSSVSAIIPSPNWPADRIKNEDCWTDIEYCKQNGVWYPLSKTLAEKEAWKFAEEKDLDIVVVNPGTVMGPIIPPTLNASMLMILRLLQGCTDTYQDFFMGLVHVKDIALAHILVYENKSAKGRHLCVEAITHYGDFAAKVAELYPEYNIPRLPKDTQPGLLRRPLNSLRPTETLELESGLSLVPRIKLLLTVYRADKSVNPIDEWKFKRSLFDYIKSSFSITVPEEDLEIRRFKDLHKRKREEPVARGRLFVYDLGFLAKVIGETEEDVERADKKFLEWRRGFVEKLDGIELNLEGTKFNLNVAVPVSDDFEGMKKEWEEIIAFGARGYRRSGKMQPDTIVLKGMPSRWFAETRVSSKPSMLVTHTIVSALGKVRNLHVAEDNGIGDDAEEEDIVSGLHCKIVVRFEKHKDFYDALKILCGRSLQKQGSRLAADYDVTWDKDGFFRDARHQIEERKRMPTRGVEDRDEGHRQHLQVSQFSSEEGRRKRFKE